MDKKFSIVLICLAVISLAVSSMITTKVLNKMNEKITKLEEDNKSILYQYELQQEKIDALKSEYTSYASETDAKMDTIEEDVQELKLEKEIKDVELHEEPESTVVGTYELTAYIATGNPCADGVYPSVGYTAACNDPNLWHKWIHIDGYGDYYVHDRGGMASNVIDLFVSDYNTAIQFGRRTATVSIIDK